MITIRQIVALLVFACAMARAQDWPQFLGPARNGVYAGPGRKAGALVWKMDVGEGFAAPVVVQGKLIVFHRVKDKEIVECLQADTGRRIWRFDYPTRYRDDFGFDEGPRAAPAIDGGRVYVFGAEGSLHSLELASGKEAWSVDTHEKFGVRKGFFGAACSPLIEGNLVLMNIGGRSGAGLVAFDKVSGKLAWTALADEASYSSPVAATLGGLRTALFFTRAGLAAVDPSNGKLRYHMAWRSRSQASVNAAAPIVVDDLVFLSASYSTGAVLLQAAGSDWKRMWSSDDSLSCHYSTPVHRGGYLYGFHGRQEEGPSLRCIEMRTGKTKWSVDGFGAGSITLAGEQILVLKENGELVSAPASPDGFRPSASAKLLPGTVRAYPALADGRIYVRNEKTLACYRLE